MTLERILEGIKKLFGDTSRPADETREDLEAVKELVEELLATM